MALQTYTKMAVAYNNLVNPANVVNVATSGISTFLGGFPASNLEYEDPWVLMKTGSISGQPIIEHEFTAVVPPTVLGILNHNIGSAGYTTITVEKWNGATWDSMAAMTITATGDSDIWVAWTTPIASTRWRFKLGTGAAGNFYIGSVFYGIVHICETNPLTFNQQRRTPLSIETASGGARYTSFGADVRTGFAEITYQRTTLAEVDFYRQLAKYSLLGFLTPEHGDANTIIVGQEVFWGYLVSRTTNPRGPGGQLTAQAAKYDMTIELEGAV